MGRLSPRWFVKKRMVRCNLIIDCPSRYKVNRESVRMALVRTLEGQHVEGDVEVEVSVVGGRKMRQLHKQYLETEEATDVMSWPFEFDKSIPDGITRLGCIVVCYPVMVKEAANHSRSLDWEVERLVEHGCLHLLGIHHE